MGKKNKKLNIPKEDLLQLYVEEKLSTVQIAERYGCTSACIRGYLIKNNIPRRTDSEANKIRMNNRSEETLRLRAKRVRQTWYSRPEEERQIINKSRATKPEHMEAAYQKRLNTVREKQGGTKSKAEESFYHQLLVSFDEEDILRGYSEERYPFMSDFYIKSLDLFIEYQGHYSHGPRPYNPLDPVCIEYLENLEKHGIDSYTWTVRDVKKLKQALSSGVKLALVYPHRDWYMVENGQIRTLQPNELWSMQ